jgi:hypothetical protein
MGVCLIAGALSVALGAGAFTLAWTHSIEKVRWEEDYHVQGDLLLLDSARIRGSGAGMEPPDGALLRDGAWHYRPALNRFRELNLMRSEFVPDYQVCIDGTCREMSYWLGPRGGNAVVRPCPR